MTLIWRFNLVLIAIFVVGFAISGVMSYRVVHANAREEILDNARLMIESASSSRNYTSVQIKPLLETQIKYTFLPQSVPDYAATEQFSDLRKKYPDYGYREATLNPTNPRDRATDWEADIVTQFRQAPDRTEIVAERDTPAGPSLILARPIQIKDAACLTCHSTVEAAPKTMIDLYGTTNGFGWKLNDTVGAQIVTVPTKVAIQRANYTFKVFMLSLGVVFLLTFIMLNVTLHMVVIRRVKRLSRLADEVSLGNLEAGDFLTRSNDEIGVLTEALSRMKKSLVQAMKMLE